MAFGKMTHSSERYRKDLRKLFRKDSPTIKLLNYTEDLERKLREMAADKTWPHYVRDKLRSLLTEENSDEQGAN